MNVKQAKELALVDFIQHIGHEPTSIRGNDVWFRSPLRPEERTPSFKVDARRNIWYDHGQGIGGTIIDFVEHYYKAPDVSNSLSIIESVSGGGLLPAVSRVDLTRIEKPTPKPVIERVAAIADRGLERYLESRAIPLDLARLYLKEIDYRIDDRVYRALAFQNDAAGYEVRNADWKGSIGTKDITSFQVQGRTDVALFEGAFDFLGTLAHFHLEAPRGNAVVMNSVALIERAEQQFERFGVTKVFAYLDHDRGGRETLARLEASERWLISDESAFYLGYKDVNEFLQGQENKRDTL